MSQLASILCLLFAGACSDAKDDTKQPPAKPAAAPAADAAFTLECEAPEKVAVGDTIHLKCTLKNSGPDAQVREAMFDAKSFDFTVKFGNSPESRFTEYHVTEEHRPLSLAAADVKQNGALEFTLDVPALKAGKWTFTPHYNGTGKEPVHGAAKVITVEAKDGSSETIAHVVTDSGELKVEFWPEVAPATTLHIASLIKKGFYDGLKFHRTIKGFMIQGGDPKGDGTGGPGYGIQAEFNDRHHEAGVFSMARSRDPNSGGSQFFLCDADAGFLDHQYTAFGKVIEGIDVVHAIAAAPAVMAGESSPSKPVNPVKMTKAELVLKK